MPDFSLWDNPLYAVKMEKPIVLEPSSDTGSGTVIACALSSNMRQVLYYHDNEDIEHFQKEMLEFAMPIEADVLEQMGDLSASELTGTLIVFIQQRPIAPSFFPRISNFI